MSPRVITASALRDNFAARHPKRLGYTEETRMAAVAAVLRFSRDDTEVLLIRRAEHPDDHWSGHMAFPGGRRDEGDDSTLATAIRETREEVAIDLDSGAELLGQLDDIQAISKGARREMIIVPYVFELTGAVSPVLDSKEVAELTWTSIVPMMRGEVDTVRPYVHEGKELRLPGYRVADNIVWGLTYQMLELLFDVIRR